MRARFEFRVAEADDIAAVIDRYAEAADRCVRAGFDGVELHAGHGYLIDEFLSPHNTRRRVGRRPRRAVATLVEIIGAIRARVGARFPSGSGSTPPSRTRTTANGSTSSSR